MKLEEGPNPQHPEESCFFWTVSFCLHHTMTNFGYKYILYDTEMKAFIKNRKVSRVFAKPSHEGGLQTTENHCSSKNYETSQSELPPLSETVSPITTEIYINDYTKVDEVNYSDFIYNRITPKLLLGASINDISEIQILKEDGVDVVLNLQTQSDINKHNAFHDEVLEGYKQEGIEYLQIPINERNTEEVILGCYRVSKILNDLLLRSKVVYIHCTYGAVRSVHTLISYLCLFQKFDINKAIEFVTKRRSLAIPSIGNLININIHLIAFN